MSKALLITVLLSASYGVAFGEDIVAFRFTGALFNEMQVFGHTIGPNDLVSGHVSYRLGVMSTGPVVGCDDCAGYPVDLVNGFSVRVGALDLRYDSYAITISNDGPGLDPEFPEDALLFGRRQHNTTPYERRLLVNGVHHPIGFVDVTLVGLSSTFPSSDLPDDPLPSDFFIGYLLIDDGSGVPVGETEQRSTGFVGGILDAFGMERFNVREGDYFIDGEVSGEDYDVWRSGFGSALNSSADGNRDGVVDAADYTIWRDAMESAPLSAPEPSSIVIAIFAFTIAALRNASDVR